MHFPPSLISHAAPIHKNLVSEVARSRRKQTHSRLPALLLNLLPHSSPVHQAEDSEGWIVFSLQQPEEPVENIFFPKKRRLKCYFHFFFLSHPSFGETFECDPKAFLRSFHISRWKEKKENRKKMSAMTNVEMPTKKFNSCLFCASPWTKASAKWNCGVVEMQLNDVGFFFSQGF